MNTPFSAIDKSRTRIGFIGTGVMGLSMCSHIMNQGFATCVSNRTKEKAAPLLKAGAAWADTPKEVASQSDIVFTIVGFPKDVHEVYFGQQGVFAGLKPGSICVDMTTTSPTLAKEIAAKALQQDCAALDAPVSGGDIGAKNAALSIMVGGSEAAFTVVRPLFELMGKLIVRQGEAGAGQHTKMCNQIVIAGSMIGMCESLLYATAAGLDITTVLSSIAKGAAGCWSLENLAPRIVKGDFAPGFMIDHFVKDMGIALEEAKAMSLELPGLSLVSSIYEQAQIQGLGRNGTQALFLALKKISEDRMMSGDLPA